MRLANKRILVVGASSGLGRASGLAIAAEGGQVAFAARRVDRLEEAVAEAKGKSIAVPCDVTDEASCDAAVSAAVSAFGGLDAVVYTPGIAHFGAIADLVAEDWNRVFQTNVTGATCIARAALPHLAESRGKAVFFSSIVIDDRPPRTGSAPYVVTKRALEALIEAWQAEHHEVSFTTIAMADSVSEFGLGHDPAVMGPIVARWAAQGLMYGRIMQPDAVAEQTVNVLATKEHIRRLALTPTYAVEGQAQSPAEIGDELRRAGKL